MGVNSIDILAILLLSGLMERAGHKCLLNELSNTVVFPRPSSDDFIRKWQLACQGNIAHVVVMPNVTPAMLQQFVSEYSAIEAQAAAERESHRAGQVCSSPADGGTPVSSRALDPLPLRLQSSLDALAHLEAEKGAGLGAESTDSSSDSESEHVEAAGRLELDVREPIMAEAAIAVVELPVLQPE